MKQKTKFCFALAVAIFGNASAMTIKGVTLGSQTSHRQLAKMFGSVSCPGEEEHNRSERHSRTLGKDNYLTCTVPISFMGILTTADIQVSGEWLVSGFLVEIPSAQGDLVEQELIKRYGSPDEMRGSENSEMLHSCSLWHRVEDAGVAICGWRSWNHFTVSYWYIGPANLNSRDF